MNLIDKNGLTTAEGIKLANTLFEATEPIYKEYISKGADPQEVKKIAYSFIEPLLCLLYEKAYQRRDN